MYFPASIKIIHILCIISPSIKRRFWGKYELLLAVFSPLNIMKNVWILIKKTIKDWLEDGAPRLAAALSYYAIFSLVPLLVIAIGIAGLFFQQGEVKAQVADQIAGVVGADAAETVMGWLDATATREGGIIATILGFLALLFGATGFFGQLQTSLNIVWEVHPAPNRGVKGMLKDRFTSFLLILFIGLLLLVLMVLNTVLSTMGDFIENLLPGGQIIWMVVNYAINLALVVVLFAAIFKVLPDVQIRWRDVWVGALATAVLFVIGQILIGLYLSNAAVGSAYGAAGSAVIFLLWIYYSTQILFLGAEFTQVYARRHGTEILPTENAISLREERTEAQTGQKGRQPGDVPGIRVRPPKDYMLDSVKHRNEIIRPTSQPPKGFFALITIGLLTLVGWIFAVYRLVFGRSRKSVR
jgi:membrane protein